MPTAILLLSNSPGGEPEQMQAWDSLFESDFFSYLFPFLLDNPTNVAVE